jgi:hypothetical protein
MFAKIVIVAILLGIIASLGMALIYMVKDRGTGTRTAKALTLRIGVSIGLFLLLMVLGATGVLTPHGIHG